MSAPTKSDHANDSSSGDSTNKATKARFEFRGVAYPLPSGFTRTRLVVLALSLFVASSVLVWAQMRNYAPARWRYQAPHGLVAWLQLPLEIHRHAALIDIVGTPNSIAQQPEKGTRVWMVGNAGLLVFSDDDGRSWSKLDYDATRGEFRLPGVAASPAATPSSKAAPSASSAILSMFSATVFAQASTQDKPNVQQQVSSGDVEIQPRRVNFGRIEIGRQSPFEAVLIHNAGKVPITVRVARVAGDEPTKDFEIKLPCKLIEAGGSCQIGVSFRPSTTGARSASIVIDFGGKIPETIQLSAEGLAQPLYNPPNDPPSKDSNTNIPSNRPPSPLTPMRTPPDLLTVTFTSKNQGVISAGTGLEFATADGGSTWTQRAATGRGAATPGTSALWKIEKGGVYRQFDGVWYPVTRAAIPASERGGDGRHWLLLPPWYFLALAISLLLGSSALFVVETKGSGVEDGIPQILSRDSPLEPGDPDVLNLHSIAAGLSRFIRNENTVPPLTVAVTGEWGSGKSSLMNLLKKDLESYGLQPIWFNAWHHQKEEQLLAALLQTVRLQAVPPPLAASWLPFRLRLLRKRLERHWATLALVACGVVMLYAIESKLEGAGENTTLLEALGLKEGSSFEWLKVLGRLPHLSTFAGAAALITFLVNALRAFGLNPSALLTSSSSGTRMKDLDAQTGFRQRFAVEFKDVTDALGWRQLVIFIDDLDRCRPENVRDVLEAVNFLVSSGPCFVVMGMARAQVERSVGVSFSDVVDPEEPDRAATAGGAQQPTRTPEQKKVDAQIKYAKKYLDKLINIEVPVPIPNDEQKRDLLLKSGLRPAEAREKAADRRARVWAGAVQNVLPIALGGLLAFSAFQIGQEVAPWLATVMGGPARPPAANTSSGAGTTQTPPPNSGGNAGTTTGTGPATPPTIAPGAPRTTPPLPVITSATATVPTSWMLTWPAILGLLGLLLVGKAALSIAGGLGLEHDSDTFAKALAIWSPLVMANSNSPRAAKRFLNRVRFMAMRQRQMTTSSRLVRAFFPTRIARIDPNEIPPERIPESLLVPLAAFEQFSRSWVDTDAQLGQVVTGEAKSGYKDVDEILTKARQEHEKAAAEAASLNADRENRFRSLSDATSCRERFLELWPSVTVR